MMTLALLGVVLAAVPRPVFPAEERPWYPAQLEQQGPKEISAASLEDAQACASCHHEIAQQWRTSAHAFASFNNPLYRVSVEGMRTAAGTRPSRMCAGCHDLALLTEGEMDKAEIDPADPRAHAGVSCTSCHSTIHAAADGNGSLVLRSDSPFPSAPAEATLEKHRARVAPKTLRTAALCGACHRSALDPATGNAAAFSGMDDTGAWLKSAYGGQLAERPDEPIKAEDCRACHMKREQVTSWDVAAKEGTVPSHRFLGAHTALAAMRHDDAQLGRVRAMLEGSVTVDVPAVRRNGGEWSFPAGAAQAAAGDVLEADVVVFNERVGHRFPSGVLDNQQTRLEVELVSAGGEVLAASREHELRSEAVNKDGVPLAARQTHEIVTAVWNHSVPARDARAIRVRFAVPTSLDPSARPLSVRARLVHASRSDTLMASACADTRTERGRAYDVAAKSLGYVPLDACVAQPVTELAAAVARLDGKGSPVTADWRRAYHWGLGLAVGLQEYLGEAEVAFQRALALVPAGDPRALGQVRWGLGAVAGRRGQVVAAEQWLDLSRRALGDHPAIDKSRGDAYAQVWRWPEAAKAYTAAAARAPNDVTLWQSLAMAEASAGHPAKALAAAQRGIALNPRDGDCLRVQALALAELGAPKTQVDQALEVALHWRTPDGAPKAKALCSKNVPGCAQRRDPVPRYEAVPAGAVGVALPEPP